MGDTAIGRTAIRFGRGVRQSDEPVVGLYCTRLGAGVYLRLIVGRCVVYLSWWTAPLDHTTPRP